MRLSDARLRLVDRLSRRFFYGWAMAAVAALGIFASGPGQSHTFRVFVGPIGADLGLSGTTIASAYGLAILAAALGLPYMGRLVRPVRRPADAAGGALGLGAARLAFGDTSGVAWLGVGFAALRFLSQGLLMLGCAYLVSQWFARRRGFALGLMALAFSASMAVHPPLAQALIDAVGWRQARLWLGLLTWLLLLPPVLLLVQNRPEDLGLRPDGDRPPAPPAMPPQPATAYPLPLRRRSSRA